MSLITREKAPKNLVSVSWPTLERLRLGDQALFERNLGIGGSDANVILSGNSDRVRQLWLEKRGEAERPDLSGNLAVMLGCWTEPFNRMWFEQETGQKLGRTGEVIQCTRYEWRRCTLDGVIEEAEAVWEAKHTNAFSSSDEVVERYMPQLQHNMAVLRAERAFLSVIFGSHKFEVIEVAADWLYQLDLLEAEEDFWECVVTGREPVAAPVPAPPKPIGVREVCLEGNNAWAAAAADWIDNRDAAKVHTAASKALKEMVEPDVARVFGHGVEAKRSRSGAITIRGLRQ
jgi:predicted phage-related endonuclease